MILQLCHDWGFRWFRRGDVWAKGYLFDARHRLHDAEALAAYFSGISSETEFRAKLLEANGSFAVVIARPELQLAAVDRLRSIPLFYSFRDGELHVSDDAYRLHEHLGDRAFAKRSAAEFLRSGYVVGEDTLLPSIKQIRAGAYLSRGAARPSQAFYYQHLHGDYLNLDEKTYFEQLDALSTRVFQRLIDSAGGKPLVVPLSGGYDSRYVAAMLKRLEYPRVICYTYGRTSSFEVATSRQVAERLGFPWHFVEYTPEKWVRHLDDPAAKAYYRYAGNLASLPHIQDFVALHELREAGHLPPDAVFVPGFCGDLLGGSYVPAEGGRPARASDLMDEGIAAYLYRQHLNLENPLPRPMTEQVKEHIAVTLRAYPPTATLEDFISVNEAWFTEHKIAKFVVNALRPYEFFGYGWRMPLWDNELAEYWYRIPLVERVGDKLYDRYLLTRVFSPYQVAFVKAPRREGAEQRIKRLLPLWLRPHLKRIYRRFPKRTPRSDINRSDINAFAALAEHLRQDMQRAGRPLPPSQDINQTFAAWFLAYLERELAQDCPAAHPAGLGA